MVTREMEPQTVDRSLIGALEFAGEELPYVDLVDWPFIGTKLAFDGTEYSYDRSFPIKGYSAIMPAYIAELHAKGRKMLIVERPDRYYVYVA